MNHVKNLKGYRDSKNKVNEAIFVNDAWELNVYVKVPQSLLTKYAKKVEQNTGKKLADIYSTEDYAKKLIEYIVADGLDVDKIPATALTGVQTQPMQLQAQPQAQPAQAQVQAQPADVQVQSQPVQSQENFEEVESKEELPA